MFGAHLSISGGLENALLEAQSLGMDCVQIFTKNQRQWKTKPLTDEQVAAWNAAREKTGIDRVVSHDSYLINLASPDAELREKSIALFREELSRCEALGVQDLVTHPGAHMGAGEAEGLGRVAKALDQLHKELAGFKTITLLEITAGQGTSLGYSLEHLKSVIDQVKAPERVGVCLDTCHLIAAGYDLTSGEGAAGVLEDIDRTVGLDRVRCIHVNDSKTEHGSRKDRHEHIGFGHVSEDAFRVILGAAAVADTPKVLETAKGKDDAGENWDAINLKAIKRLAGVSA